MKRVFLKLEEAILGPWFRCPGILGATKDSDERQQQDGSSGVRAINLQRTLPSNRAVSVSIAMLGPTENMICMYMF